MISGACAGIGAVQARASTSSTTRRATAHPMQAAFAYVAHGGVLVLVSVVPDDITFSDPEFHKRENDADLAAATRRVTDLEHVIASIPDGRDPDRPACHASHDAPRQPTRHRAVGAREVRPDQGHDRRHVARG